MKSLSGTNSGNPLDKGTCACFFVDGHRFTRAHPSTYSQPLTFVQAPISREAVFSAWINLNMRARRRLSRGHGFKRLRTCNSLETPRIFSFGPARSRCHGSRAVPALCFVQKLLRRVKCQT